MTLSAARLCPRQHWASYENCQDDAFHTARPNPSTVAPKAWGGKSPELANWITGQDAVFSNCGGAPGDYPPRQKQRSLPHTTHASPCRNAPVLLRQESRIPGSPPHSSILAEIRPGSRRAFQSIANDPDSPWRGLSLLTSYGPRTLIRESLPIRQAR